MLASIILENFSSSFFFIQERKSCKTIRRFYKRARIILYILEWTCVWTLNKNKWTLGEHKHEFDHEQKYK